MKRVYVFDYERKEDMLRMFMAKSRDIEWFGCYINYALEFIQENHGRIIDVNISHDEECYFGVITYRGNFLVTVSIREEPEDEIDMEIIRARKESETCDQKSRQ